MDHAAPTPDERRDRRLAAFARWLTTTLSASEAVRDSIIDLARGIDAGKGSRTDQAANLALLDELLAEEIGRQYRPPDER